MWLPTQAQVNAATRNIASAAAGAVLMFGLSTKINPDTVNTVVTAVGSFVGSVVTFLGVIGPIVAAYYASKSASAASQAAAVGATGAIVVATPEIAAATPNSPNVMSSNDVKVVQK